MTSWTAVFVEVPEGYAAFVEELPGANAQGATLDEARHNLQEAIELVKELDIPVAYLTHISHQLGRHEEVEAELPQGIHLAYDGLLLTSD